MTRPEHTCLQFVWWPRLSLWFTRDEGALGRVYSWRMMVGPLEIRRWHP